eukprot:CAMPEP_0183296856 /NCGR_PEP_ID=MMETSP0160_2-20130417/4282_1 /TAXON_ID=2839 ORGANISM="Odontella Sinensis, Strain Grunow 1884" /NCGR_SAMPLE_ID=MMETSP0160_2 /ASSEMBLY_ACC=CAM_ASM_000250 /LENGTH=45 /DNA_ID= /DNA_START= /DNA_END= /DNA_ORIENTATION=
MALWWDESQGVATSSSSPLEFDPHLHPTKIANHHLEDVLGQVRLV